MKLSKYIAVSTICLGLVTSTGCAVSGRPASDYRKLQLAINYTNTFNLEPASKAVEKIYIQTRDLTGTESAEAFNNYLIYNLRTNPGLMITNDPVDADLILYTTISSITTGSSQGYGGTAIGAAGGIVTGSIIESSRHRGYYDYGYNGWIPLLFAGLGAGIGYAIDSSMTVQSLNVIEDVEVRQCQLGSCETYGTRITVHGSQMNMNKGEALGTMLSHSARGITELLKH